MFHTVMQGPRSILLEILPPSGPPLGHLQFDTGQRERMSMEDLAGSLGTWSGSGLCHFLPHPIGQI